MSAQDNSTPDQQGNANAILPDQHNLTMSSEEISTPASAAGQTGNSNAIVVEGAEPFEPFPDARDEARRSALEPQEAALVVEEAVSLDLQLRQPTNGEKLVRVEARGSKRASDEHPDGRKARDLEGKKGCVRRLD
ncbi:MAG: hypothetical protein LQ348_004227 [Seirophora lacunosa]|nr:MAG: hypothetical protein LQ348_004227 [Seirophora lacunosa]